MTDEQVLSAISDSYITHFSFMYHYPGYSQLPFFYNLDTIQEEPPSLPKYNYFSNRVIALIKQVVSQSPSLIVDILCCSLTDPLYKEEVLKVEQELGINIRYSSDLTGNATEGANWIMESELPEVVNVKDTYFTDRVLEWNGVLTSDITTLVKGGNTYSEFIIWNSTTKTYTVQNNFSWANFLTANGLSDVDSFITLSNSEVFDGAGFAIDISGYNSWNGLIRSTATITATPIIIKNLGIENGTTGTNAGFIIRYSQKYFRVINCYSTGIIGGLRSGGIAGAGAGVSCNITNCYSKGNISAASCGGIVGSDAGFGGSCRISNCYSTGSITGNASGGIVGSSAGSCNPASSAAGLCTITNCYNIGASIISGGGIAGSLAGSSTVSNSLNSVCIISNCYTTGIIGNAVSGSAGGIVGVDAGKYAGAGGSCTINNCYSTGNIIRTSVSAGIVPSGAVSCTINNCVSNGNITTPTSSITPTNSSSSLSNINGTLSTYLPSTNWTIGNPGTSINNYSLPILKSFKSFPWDSTSYTKVTDLATYLSSNIYTKNTAITSISVPVYDISAITSYSISPSLPSGLLFNTTTGIISGTPTIASNKNCYIITATNASAQVGITNILLKVNDVAPNISYSSSNITFTKGSLITDLTLTNTGGNIVSYDISGTLPTGLSFINGTISGTPTQLLTQTSYIVTATNSGGSSSATINITVNDPIQVVDPNPNSRKNITVNLNVTVDASGEVKIFGASPNTPSSDIIVAQYHMPVDCLYTGDASGGLIEFWEPSATLGTIVCRLADGSGNGHNYIDFYKQTAKKLAKGLQRVLCDQFDCSGATPYFNNANPTKYSNTYYTMISDFGRVALSLYADKLFGHAAATAAITNDKQFMAKMLSISESVASDASGTAIERYNGWNYLSNIDSWNCSDTTNETADLARKLVATLISKGIGSNGSLLVHDISGSYNGPNSTLAEIVKQVLGQDASRAMNQDNNELLPDEHQLLQFYSGDTIYVSITIKPPTVSVNPTLAQSAQQAYSDINSSMTQDVTYNIKITLDNKTVNNIGVAGQDPQVII
jgi:hypothetical protein